MRWWWPLRVPVCLQIRSLKGQPLTKPDQLVDAASTDADWVEVPNANDDESLAALLLHAVASSSSWTPKSLLFIYSIMECIPDCAKRANFCRRLRAATAHETISLWILNHSNFTITDAPCMHGWFQIPNRLSVSPSQKLWRRRRLDRGCSRHLDDHRRVVVRWFQFLLGSATHDCQ